MDISFRKATAADYEAVLEFYYTLIDDMQGTIYNAAWQKDIYPERSFLAEKCECGEMKLALADGRIVGAMVINNYVNEGYNEVSWPIKAEPSEVTCIHILAVAMDMMGKGIGKGLVEEAKRIARENSQKVIRLDVLKGNIPAFNLYEKAGFYFVQKQELFYEDVGTVEFSLYEFEL